jgi:hypothetical protein
MMLKFTFPRYSRNVYYSLTHICYLNCCNVYIFAKHLILKCLRNLQICIRCKARKRDMISYNHYCAALRNIIWNYLSLRTLSLMMHLVQLALKMVWWLFSPNILWYDIWKPEQWNKKRWNSRQWHKKYISIAMMQNSCAWCFLCSLHWGYSKDRTEKFVHCKL